MLHLHLARGGSMNVWSYLGGLAWHCSCFSNKGRHVPGSRSCTSWGLCARCLFSCFLAPLDCHWLTSSAKRPGRDSISETRQETSHPRNEKIKYLKGLQVLQQHMEQMFTQLDPGLEPVSGQTELQRLTSRFPMTTTVRKKVRHRALPETSMQSQRVSIQDPQSTRKMRMKVWK